MSTMPAKPTIIDKWLHVAQDGYSAVTRYFENRYDWNARAQGKPLFIVLHIQQGSSRNSWGWFHQTEASSTVMANRDGSIWRLVPEQHGPWTNGDDILPTSIGQRLVDLPGNSNIWTLSIETEGFSYEPNDFGWAIAPTAAQLEAVVWQIVTWMKQYDIPVKNLIRHKDLNLRDKLLCPGDAYFNTVVHRVGELMGTVGTGIDYAIPQPVLNADGTKWNGTKDVVVNGLTFHGDVKTVKAGKNGATCRQWASTDAEQTRGKVPAGESFGVLGWVKGEEVNKEARWWITKSGSRVHILDTVERPTVAPQPGPDENPYDKVVNGIRFHAVNANGTTRSVTCNADGIRVFKYATTASETVRAPLYKGEKFQAQYWVHGQNIHDEDRWWVTNYGSRIHVGGTVEKP